MRLPRFLLAYNKAALPMPVIISTQKPYHVGQVWTYMDRDKFAERLAKEDMVAYAVVPGYNIIVSYAGTMDGMMVADPSIIKGLKEVMEDMAGFFYQEAALAKPGRYNKMKSYE